MKFVGALDKDPGPSASLLKVVDTCPLSGSCTNLDHQTPFANPKCAKKIWGRLSCFGKPKKPPTLEVLPLSPSLLDKQQDDQKSESSSWIVLESPAREQRVFTELQHCTSFEIIRPEAIELVHVATTLTAPDIDDVALMQQCSNIIKSLPKEVALPVGVVETDAMKVPVHLASCSIPGGGIRLEGDSCGSGGVPGGCQAGEGLTQPDLSIRSRLLTFTEEELVFPQPRVSLGAGGFGVVYRARYKSQDVAVKQIDPMFSTIDMRESLQNELEVLSEVPAHENVVTLLGGQANAECCYIVMELMETDLHRLIHPGGAGMGVGPPAQPMPTMEVLQMGIDIARGLAHLHPNILHRDLKPRNILIKNGVAKVADFGLSAIKQKSYVSSGGLTGTVEYMSPESMMGRVNHKSDIYSLGILLWECVTGLKPFLDIPTVYGILYAVGIQAQRPDFPTSVQCPPALRALIESCWKEDPHERPDCAEVMVELERISAGLLGGCHLVGCGPDSENQCSKHRL